MANADYPTSPEWQEARQDYITALQQYEAIPYEPAAIVTLILAEDAFRAGAEEIETHNPKCA